MPYRIGGRTVVSDRLGSDELLRKYVGSSLVWERAAAPPPAQAAPRITSLSVSPSQIRTDQSGIPRTVTLRWSFAPAPSTQPTHITLHRTGADGVARNVPLTSPTSVVGLPAPTDPDTAFTLTATAGGATATRTVHLYRGVPASFAGRGLWYDPDPPSGYQVPAVGGGTLRTTYVKWHVAGSPFPTVTVKKQYTDPHTGATSFRPLSVSTDPSTGMGSVRQQRTVFGSAQSDLYEVDVQNPILSLQGAALASSRQLRVSWPV